MNLNKDTPQTNSEKAAVRALIDAGIDLISPLKSSMPVLDRWVLQNNSNSSVSNKENFRSFKLPPKPAIRIKTKEKQVMVSKSTRNSSSLCKSSRESHNFRMPLALIPFSNDQSSHITSKSNLNQKAKARSTSLADRRNSRNSKDLNQYKSQTKQMEIPEIRKALFSLIVKNNLLTKFKSQEPERKPSTGEKFNLKSLRIYLNY